LAPRQLNYAINALGILNISNVWMGRLFEGTFEAGKISKIIKLHIRKQVRRARNEYVRYFKVALGIYQLMGLAFYFLPLLVVFASNLTSKPPLCLNT